jgi:hypothetical protein
LISPADGLKAPCCRLALAKNREEFKIRAKKCRLKKIERKKLWENYRKIIRKN